VPEGDTVWRTARRLDQALTGRPLTESDFRVPTLAVVDLVGQPVDETVSRGKHLLTRLPEVTIHTHLKMEGSWHIYRPGSRWRSPAHQARLVLANADWRAVGFRLGTVELCRRDDEQSVVGHLGPDVLGDDWSADDASARLQADHHRPIGEALLDQRNLAGLGTLYMAETLFLAGICPLTPVAGAGDIPSVVSIASRLLVANRDDPRQVTTGVARRGHEHWVYRRPGQPCRRCGAIIVSASVGAPPYDRMTYWCPTCQPEHDRGD
jgi:endonuclease VIII